MTSGGTGFSHPVSKRSLSHRQHTDDPNADNPRADHQHTVLFSAESGLIAWQSTTKSAKDVKKPMGTCTAGTGARR